MELRRHVHGERNMAEASSGVLSVRCGLKQIAADREKELQVAVVESVERLHRVETVLAWRVDLELLVERGEKGLLGRSQTPIVRSPCTLLLASTQHAPAPGRPMWPPSSKRLST